MGNTQTRLIAEKQRVVGQCLEEMRAGLTSHQIRRIKLELMGRLNDRGYHVRMLGGDRVWGKDEEPPSAEEIRAAEVGVEADDLHLSLYDDLIRERYLVLSLREEIRSMRREIGQLLETWDNTRDLPGGAGLRLASVRVQRRLEDLRQFAPGVLREDEDGAPYPEETQE